MTRVGVESLVLKQRGRTLAKVSLGLTIYLAEAPRASVAKAALAVYRSVCPPDRQGLVSATGAPAYAKAEDEIGAKLLEGGLERMDRRIDHGIGIWDGRSSDSWAFALQGVPPVGETKRASYCQVFMPATADPEILHRVALALADVVPFLSGHGGFAASFDPEFVSTAFDQIFVWAKRHPGIEVEDLNLTLAHVVDRVKGANWLSLVGSTLSLPGDPASLGEDVAIATKGYGVVLRAGAQPMLGDRNRAEWPERVIRVERFLEPLKLPSHPEFAGRFQVESATMPWLRRYLEPERW